MAEREMGWEIEREPELRSTKALAAAAAAGRYDVRCGCIAGDT